jgi:hypothetical protein
LLIFTDYLSVKGFSRSPDEQNMKWETPFSLLEYPRSLLLSSPILHSLANRRVCTRVPLSISTVLHLGAGSLIAGHTKDLSETGLFLVCDQHLPLGVECQVAFLPEGSHPLPSLPAGTIVRVTDLGVGIEFSERMEKDVFQHLCASAPYPSPPVAEFAVYKRRPYRTIFGFSASLVLLPVGGQADVVIKFTDGHQVTVDRYVDEGSTIKVYTSLGVVGFRKDEVKWITAADAGQNMHMQLKKLHTQDPLSTPQVSTLLER